MQVMGIPAIFTILLLLSSAHAELDIIVNELQVCYGNKSPCDTIRPTCSTPTWYPARKLNDSNPDDIDYHDYRYSNFIIKHITGIYTNILDSARGITYDLVLRDNRVWEHDEGAD
ncbi:hypothetical protein BJ508DRAFT_329840 [Ascobolus immersus RN42]|uniref:Uncharacterized protein n=1 Tax=Ascobolus immersus RN42 TaxID=1160509 RepID=A0A3N4HZC3_ASCIM|nr:hypothetical protein BJ508DRAFT_329840 [Ascobolus immersus RN42]